MGRATGDVLCRILSALCRKTWARGRMSLQREGIRPQRAEHAARAAVLLKRQMLCWSKGVGSICKQVQRLSWVRAKTSRAAMRCCKKQKGLQMLCQAGCCGSMHCIAHCRSSSRRASRFSRLATSCCIARFCVERTSCCASSCSVLVSRAAMCSACMSCCDGAAESCDADEDVRKSWRRGPTKRVHASR